MKNTKDSSLAQLHAQAVRAQKNAYAPYSGFHVGAALRTTEGEIYSGCNVENASYGGTICAERTAITAAVADQGKIQIQEICVVTDVAPGTKPWPPCGLCRQVIMEFAVPQTLVHVASPKSVKKTYRFKDLFPDAFGPKNLK